MKSKIIIWQLVLFICLSGNEINYAAVKKREAYVADKTIARIQVNNPSDLPRSFETVEIAWTALPQYKTLNPKQILVKESATGTEIPSQVIYHGHKTPQSLLFQVSLEPKAKKAFVVAAGKPATYPAKTYGRQVPERFDDFAWENNLVAFRMYGEALEMQKGNAKGIDFWAKRTPDLVIDKWYKANNYHTDQGEGVDAYHVGLTLGAGNAAPIIGEKIIYPPNYSDYKILDKGPVRFTFQLLYKPSTVNNQLVKEVKTISLDANSQMNMITSRYETGNNNLIMAAGLTRHKGDGKAKIDSINNYMGYWDKADGKQDNGFMGVGIIVPENQVNRYKTTDQHLLALTKLRDQELTYYQGGGWSKSENFKDADAWFKYLNSFSTALKNPLKVTIK